jgi:hypothetical protein
VKRINHAVRSCSLQHRMPSSEVKALGSVVGRCASRHAHFVTAIWYLDQTISTTTTTTGQSSISQLYATMATAGRIPRSFLRAARRTRIPSRASTIPPHATRSWSSSTPVRAAAGNKVIKLTSETYVDGIKSVHIHH